MDKGEEAGSELVVANGNSAELLELEKEFLHKMAFLVKPPVDIPRVRIIRLGWDAEIRAMVGEKLPEFPLAVSSVRKDSRPLQINPVEQFFSDSDVAGIASRQNDLNRVAQGIDDGVNLGASAATAHSNALIGLGFRPDGVRLLAGGFYGISGF